MQLAFFLFYLFMYFSVDNSMDNSAEVPTLTQFDEDPQSML